LISNPISSSGASEALIGAYLELVANGTPLHDITVRSIAQRAGVSVSAVSYHFGSLDELIAVVARRAYARINLERMQLYQHAVEHWHPDPPPLRVLLDALVRPTVGSPPGQDVNIRFLLQIGSLLSRAKQTPGLMALDSEMRPHQIIVDSLHQHAPWLSRAEVGWRVHATLGIRTHVLGRSSRMRALSDNRLDLNDPEVVIGAILDLAVSMFANPAPDNGPLHRF